MCNPETAGTDSSHTERPVTENPKVAERKLGLSTSSPSDRRPGALFAYCVLQEISTTSEGDQLLQREWVSIKHLTSTQTPHLDWDAPGPTDWMCHILFFFFPIMSNQTYNLSICLIHFWHNAGKNKIQTGLGRRHTQSRPTSHPSRASASTHYRGVSAAVLRATCRRETGRWISQALPAQFHPASAGKYTINT